MQSSIPSGSSSRLPAALVFLKSCLSRDRQLTSSLQCFISILAALQSDFPANPEVGSSKRVGETKSTATDLNSALSTLKLTSDPTTCLTPDPTTRRRMDDDSWLDDDELDCASTVDTNAVSESRELQNRTINSLRIRIDELLRLILLTGRVWATLLNLLLLKIKENRNAMFCPPSNHNETPVYDSLGNNYINNIHSSIHSSHSSIHSSPSYSDAMGPVLTVDETLLIFGVQDKMVRVTVQLCQLATANVLYKNSYGAKMPWPENVRVLLQPQSLTPDLMEAVVPSPAALRRFGSDVLSCIRECSVEGRLCKCFVNILLLFCKCFVGREFELYEEQIRKEQRNRGEQQIVEQFKRSLVERTRALILISNACILGLLQCIPFDDRLSLLSREIESFTGVGRDRVPDLNSNLRASNAESNIKRHTLEDSVENVNNPLWLRILLHTIYYTTFHL